MSACQRGLRAKLLACEPGLRAKVLATQCGLRANVPNFLFLRPTVPYGMPAWRANVPNGMLYVYASCKKNVLYLISIPYFMS